MTIAVTGATGHLGRLVVEALLDRGVPAPQVVAVARDTAKAGDLAARGVTVRYGDYDRPDSLVSALDGADRVLLISGSEVGRRIPQHQAVIEAARQHEVELLAYTSIPQADTTPMQLAAEHRATEELVRESGLPYAFLRNCWYVENYTGQLATYLAHGAILGAAGTGRISGAPRADYAGAAAAVLTGEGHAKAVYELGGDESFTLAELAEVVSACTGQQVGYRDLPVPVFEQALVDAGLPAPVAATFADVDACIARGALHVTTGDLARLLGRPTTRLRDAVAAAVASDQD
jgi:NAD(P)H dehydrogenase (quinone)